MNRWMNKWINGQINRVMDEWWMNKWINGQINRVMDAWIDDYIKRTLTQTSLIHQQCK